MIPRLLATVALIAAAPAAAVAPGTDTAAPAPREIRVREGGSHRLSRFTTEGVEITRYSGFGEVSAIERYDDATVLVAERDRGALSALSLDGRLAWTIPAEGPRSVQVLAPDRFLVAEASRVVELDRSGAVRWGSPLLIDPGAALRLPDGNTAVAESSGSNAVRVLAPGGEPLWTAYLQQPRGLARLPSGQLVTSGFDTGRVVAFDPYTDRSTFFGACCHVEVAGATPQGELMVISAESQTVEAYSVGGSRHWRFETLYPPVAAAALPDGTVLVALREVPDRSCQNAGRASRARPLPWSLRWLVSAIAAAFAVSWIVRRACPGASAAVPVEQSPGASPPGTNRFQIGACVAGVLGCAAVAAIFHPKWLVPGQSRLTLYLPLVILGGASLARLQHLAGKSENRWEDSMRRLRPMPPPGRAALALWSLGVLLLATSLIGVWRQWGEWVIAGWAAALALLIGGAIGRGGKRPPLRPFRALALVALFAGLATIRILHLETCPPNLHHDMGLWTVNALQLVDGEHRSLLGHGYAEVPLIGHLWSAFWTELFGRSLAAARMASVLASLVAIAALYALSGRFFGTWVAVVAALLLGVEHEFLHYSRIQAYMDPVLFQALAALGLLRGLEAGTYGWFYLAGFSGGYSALSYHSGRITPLLLPVLAAVSLVRRPRLLAARWRGLVFALVIGAAMLAPQAILYRTARANPFGRSDVFPFVVHDRIDREALQATIFRGVPRIIGGFWIYSDNASQYGHSGPALPPLLAALLGMSVVAALLRPGDERGVLLVVWAAMVLFLGGVLTIDPPFWPRMVASLLPAAALIGASLGALRFGLASLSPRVGVAVATVAAVGLLGATARGQLDLYRAFCGHDNESVQSVMGRDIQRSSPEDQVFIVSAKPIDHSCAHPTMQYYAYERDVRDAREIDRYLPFAARRVICYVLPDRQETLAVLHRWYPKAAEKRFERSGGALLFTRLVVEPDRRAQGPLR